MCYNAYSESPEISMCVSKDTGRSFRKQTSEMAHKDPPNFWKLTKSLQEFKGCLLKNCRFGTHSKFLWCPSLPNPHPALLNSTVARKISNIRSMATMETSSLAVAGRSWVWSPFKSLVSEELSLISPSAGSSEHLHSQGCLDLLQNCLHRQTPVYTAFFKNNYANSQQCNH